MAEQICRKTLEQYPTDGNLLCLQGASLLRLRRPADAEVPLRRAVSLFPDFIRAHDELAGVLLVQHKPEEAEKILEQALSREPDNGSMLMKLGKALAALGRHDEADAAFEKSFKQTPDRFELAKAAELFAKGERGAAEKICRGFTPRPAQRRRAPFSGADRVRQKQWTDAEALLERAVGLAPDFLPAWRDLIDAYKEQDKYEQTLAALNRLLQLDAENVNMICEHANVLTMAGRHEDAVAEYERALAIAPRHAGSLSGLGHVLKTVGRQDEAVRAYRDSVAAHPGFGEAYWSLANLKTFRFEDAEIAAMTAQLESDKLPDEAKANFCFALGKAHEDAGDFDSAFRYFEQGNSVRRANESYDPVLTDTIHDRIIETCTADFFSERKGWGNPDASPILIVGLPRSGSTLIEQILASHSMAEGTHELPELSRVIRALNESRTDARTYPEALAELAADDVTDYGQDYLDRTLKHRSGMPRFTDKMPNNFPSVGFLHLVLPNATVINARRHPLDSCLGSYKQLFAKGQSFTYDQFEIGDYYLQYQRMIDHWNTVLPGKVLDVHYEDMVADQVGQTRRILEHCRLPWEENCLHFLRQQARSAYGQLGAGAATDLLEFGRSLAQLRVAPGANDRGSGTAAARFTGRSAPCLSGRGLSFDFTIWYAAEAIAKFHDCLAPWVGLASVQPAEAVAPCRGGLNGATR